jgi:murein tripeptide amidase MpaA
LNAYIDSLVGKFDNVTVESIGRSGEGRDMRVLQITKAGAGAPNVWIEAGIHAREWISPAMSTYIIEQLLFHDTNNFIEKMNFYILPSANPDGYEFSINSVSY